MKVVIDTNIFVSGIFWKGKPGMVLDAWIRADIELLISKPILDEYTKTLFELSKGRCDDIVEKWLFQVFKYSHCIEIGHHFLICRDKNDNKWLDCAASGAAEFLISGDRDLLALKSVFQIPIVKPSDFLELFNNLKQE